VTELTPANLLHAYSLGAFPMAEPSTDEVHWYSPDPRGIIPLDQFHVPRSLAKRVRNAGFVIRMDTRFETVMRACAEPRASDDQTWISEDLIRVYTQLHELGFAHSVEAWLPGDEASTAADHRVEEDGLALVGGLYGVSLRGGFFGESMFSRVKDASKVCLVHLVDHLRKQGYTLLDTQFTTDHLERFGAIEIPRAEYLAMLEQALQVDVLWSPSRGPQ